MGASWSGCLSSLLYLNVPLRILLGLALTCPSWTVQMNNSSSSDNALWEQMYLLTFGRVIIRFQVQVDWRQMHEEVRGSGSIPTFLWV